MKKLFSHQRAQIAPGSTLGFRGALTGGGTHALRPGPSRAVSGKIGMIGGFGTPRLHFGSVPLSKMRPVRGPLAEVVGRQGQLRQMPGSGLGSIFRKSGDGGG